MNPKIRSLFFACLGLLFGMSVMFVYNNFIAEKKAPAKTENISEASVNQSDQQSIDELTNENTVINYVKKNGLKIHGFAVYAKKKNLLELYKQDMVSYVQTILQN